jgi:hypothetical protein
MACYRDSHASLISSSDLPLGGHLSFYTYWCANQDGGGTCTPRRLFGTFGMLLPPLSSSRPRDIGDILPSIPSTRAGNITNLCCNLKIQ